MRDHVLDIVRRYVDERIRRSGDGQIQCRCPFHKGGMERKPSFSVNIEEGLFHCFACHESGTIPTLLRLLGLPPEVIDQETGHIRQAIRDNIENRKIRRVTEQKTKDPFRAHTVLSELIIAAFDWCPLQLTEAGFQWQWMQYLQVGVDRRNQRITYPVRDIYGNLAGFVGGQTLAGQQPKYKVYRGKRTDHQGRVIPADYGEWFDEEYPNYEFRNHDYLWNYDRVYPRILFGKEAQQLIVVEGFKAAIWLLQNGFRNVVALMGSSLSERQLQLLLRVNAEMVLFLDYDERGQEATLTIGKKLQQAVPVVRVVAYPQGVEEGCQPDHLEHSHLRWAVGSARPYHFWKRERISL